MRCILLILTLLLPACASNPDKIQSSYVSPVQYSEYSCKQVALEMANVSRRVSELHGQLKKTEWRQWGTMIVAIFERCE